MFQKVLLTVLLACVASCSHIYGSKGIIKDRDTDYLNAQSSPPLKIPAGVSSSSIQTHYPLSERHYLPEEKLNLTPPELKVAVAAPVASDLKTAKQKKSFSVSGMWNGFKNSDTEKTEEQSDSKYYKRYQKSNWNMAGDVEERTTGKKAKKRTIYQPSAVPEADEEDHSEGKNTASKQPTAKDTMPRYYQRYSNSNWSFAGDAAQMKADQSSQ